MNLQSWNSEISDAEHAIYPVEAVEKQANPANRCSKETESRTARQIDLFRSRSKATMQECEARTRKMKGRRRIIRQTRFQFPNIRLQVSNAILPKIHIFTSFKIFDSLVFLRCKKFRTLSFVKICDIFVEIENIRHRNSCLYMYWATRIGGISTA